MPGGVPSKSERIAEFFRRLADAPRAATADEAFRQVCDILNAVEDELTGIPFDPDLWMTDGRMYPPQADHARPVPGLPHLTRYRSLGHKTLIAASGAITITALDGRELLVKPGADGRTI